MTAVFWCAMTMVTVVLIVLTMSYLTHNPNTCRTCRQGTPPAPVVRARGGPP
jgi:hypothetical protein